MICFDNGPVLFTETLGISANPTSVRKVLRHLLMRMIANTLISVGISRAGFLLGRRGGVGSRQDSHHFPGPDEPGLREARFFIIFFLVWRRCDGPASSQLQYKKEVFGRCGRTVVSTGEHQCLDNRISVAV